MILSSETQRVHVMKRLLLLSGFLGAILAHQASAQTNTIQLRNGTQTTTILPSANTVSIQIPDAPEGSTTLYLNTSTVPPATNTGGGGLLYGATNPQKTLEIDNASNPYLFNISYSSASDGTTNNNAALGGLITSQATVGNNIATGLRINSIAAGTGTATGLIINATGAVGSKGISVLAGGIYVDAGGLAIKGSGSGYTIFQSGSNNTNITYTLPSTSPTGTQILRANAASPTTLEWADAAAVLPASTNDATLRYDGATSGWLPTTSISASSDGTLTLGATSTAGSLRIHDGSGGTRGVVVTSGLSADRTYTLDVDANASFVMSAGAQTIGGTKTFSTAPVLNSLTASRPLKLDALNYITASEINLASSNDVTGTLPVTNGGTGLAAYTKGDIVYASTTNTLGTLGIGTAGQYLTVSGGVPAWTTLSNQLPVGNTTNATLRYNGSSWVENVNILGASDGAITLLKATNQLNLGSGFTTTINAVAPSASRTYSIPDAGANASFVMSAGAQTIGGTKTFSAAPVLSSVTALRPLKVDVFNSVTSGTIDLTSSNDVTGTLPVTNGGTGLAAYTKGDIVYASTTNTLGTLGIGTAGQYLTVSGGVPAWATPTLLPTGTTTNATVRYNGSSWVENTNILGASDGAITLSKTTNQLTLGSGFTTTINAVAPSASRTYSIPDAGANASFVMSAGPQTIGGDKSFSGTTSINSGTATAAELRFYEPSSGGTNYSAFKAGTQSADLTYTWPTAAPSAGQALVSASDGTLSWTTVAGAGSGVNFDVSAAQTGSLGKYLFNVEYSGSGTGIGYGGRISSIGKGNNSATGLTIGVDAASNSNVATGISINSTSSGAATVNYGVNVTAGSTGAGSATGFKAAITGGATTNIGIETSASGGTTNYSAKFGPGAVLIANDGTNATEIRLQEPSGSEYTAFKAQAQSANVTYTLPADAGTNGYVLSTNGSGTLSWIATSGMPAGTTTDATIRYNGSSWVQNANVLSASDGALTLSKTTNQLTLGASGFTTTINAAAPSSSRTYTIPDAGANATFVMSAGAQTIGGTKTFSSAPVLSSLTASKPLKLDGSNNVTSSAINLATAGGEVTGTLPVANGGTGLTSYTTGDLVYASTTNTLANLGVGTAGQFLTVTGGVPAWTTLTNQLPSGTTTDATLRYNGSAWVQNANVLSNSDGALSLAKTTNQLVLGTTKTTTITAVQPNSSVTYTIPDAGANAAFVMTAGDQTITGNKTFSGQVVSNRKVTSVTTNSTVNATDGVVMVSGSGNVTITLPAASGNSGAELTIMNVISDNTKSVTINDNANTEFQWYDTSIGSPAWVSTDFTLTTGETVVLICNGTNWYILTSHLN